MTWQHSTAIFTLACGMNAGLELQKAIVERSIFAGLQAAAWAFIGIFVFW